MAKNQHLTKDEVIEKEKARLNKIYKDLEGRKKLIAEGLINEAAHMRIQLEIYRNDIDENGYIEYFTQSKETAPYERERPVARLYATLNKNYQSIIKQLMDLLPKEQPKDDEDDGFDSFVSDRE